MTERSRKNVTRRSRSIPRRLLREGAFHLLPLYYLLRLSDLGREGIDHSASFRFADHIYRDAPSGRTALGRWIDARLLVMPSARAFRRRYEHAQRVVRRALEAQAAGAPPLRVLTVPCGIPRDIVDLAHRLRAEDPALLSRLEYHGLDIDHRALAEASRLTTACGLPLVRYHLGDALSGSGFPRVRFDVVISTGLGEFLNDEELARFYGRIYDAMEPGATFYTSATGRDHRTDMLLRMVEIVTHYRTPGGLRAILDRLPWRHLDLALDTTGLQTFVTAIK